MLFHGKLVKKGALQPCGGVNLQVRGEEEYPKIRLSTNVKGWRETFFYMREAAPGNEIGIPLYQISPSRPRNLQADPEPEDLQRVGELKSLLHALMNEGLTGLNLVTSWTRRRIAPLQTRPSLLCDYTGTDDPARTTPVKWFVEPWCARMKRLTRYEVTDWKISGLPPYSSQDEIAETFRGLVGLAPIRGEAPQISTSTNDVADREDTESDSERVPPPDPRVAPSSSRPVVNLESDDDVEQEVKEPAAAESSDSAEDEEEAALPSDKGKRKNKTSGRKPGQSKRQRAQMQPPVVPLAALTRRTAAAEAKKKIEASTPFASPAAQEPATVGAGFPLPSVTAARLAASPIVQVTVAGVRYAAVAAKTRPSPLHR